MPPAPALSRRTATGGALAVTAVLATGCTGADRRPGAAGPTPSVTGSPTAVPEDPDVALARAVLLRERAMLATLQATARVHPRLRGVLASGRASHRDHVRVLSAAVPDGTGPAPAAASRRRPRHPAAVPARPSAALAALAGAEERHARDGRDSCVAARSGTFARLLASMAAAASQQAAVLSAAARESARESA